MKNLIVFSFSLVSLFSTHFAFAKADPSLQMPVVATDNKVVLPFTMHKGIIFIKAAIGKRVGEFMLDTGAPGIILNSRHFKDAEKTTLKVSGINNLIENPKVKYVAKMTAKAISWLKFDAITINLLHLEQINRREILGLIGYQAFRKHELMIDYEKQEITLFKLDKKGNKLISYDDVPLFTSKFKRLKHLAVVEVKIGKERLKLALDTGAQSNVIHKKWQKKLNRHFLGFEKINVAGAGKKKALSLQGDLNKLWIGNVAFYNTKTIFTDLSKFRQSQGIRVDGLLGYHFLKKRKVSINFTKKTISFWRKKTTPKPILPTTKKIS